MTLCPLRGWPRTGSGFAYFPWTRAVSRRPWPFAMASGHGLWPWPPSLLHGTLRRSTFSTVQFRNHLLISTLSHSHIHLLSSPQLPFPLLESAMTAFPSISVFAFALSVSAFALLIAASASASLPSLLSYDAPTHRHFVGEEGVVTLSCHYEGQRAGSEALLTWQLWDHPN